MFFEFEIKPYQKYYWRFTNAREKPRGVYAYFDTNESTIAPLMSTSETRSRCKRYYSNAWTSCNPNATIEILDGKPCYKDNNPCDKNSNACEYVGGKAKCSCPAGYKLNGFTCDDIDECQFVTCEQGWTCKNTLGSYYCSGCTDNHAMLPIPVNRVSNFCIQQVVN